MQDTEIAGYKVPARTRIFLSLDSVNHDEAVYDDPERFDSRVSKNRSPPQRNLFGVKHQLLRQRLDRFAFQIHVAGLLPGCRRCKRPENYDRRKQTQASP